MAVTQREMHMAGATANYDRTHAARVLIAYHDIVGLPHARYAVQVALKFHAMTWLETQHHMVHT